MLPTTPVPAAPTALDPLLMPHRAAGQQSLGVPVSGVRVLMLGLSPITAAAAVMLAGCGVRGFTVVDDGWVTWEGARAGAFDSTEVGMPRDLCTRRRIRAANAEAAPVTWTDDVLTDARPGRVVLRSSLVRAARPDHALPDHSRSARPLTGASREGGPDAVPRRAATLSAPGDHLDLPGAVPLVEVLALPGPEGAVVLSPGGAWRSRPCPQCRLGVAEQSLARLAHERPTPVVSAVSRAAAPAHTAWCAAAVVQAVLDAALGPAGALEPVGPAGPAGAPELAGRADRNGPIDRAGRVEPAEIPASAGPRHDGWVLAPGRPFGLRLPAAPRARDCPLCGA